MQVDDLKMDFKVLAFMSSSTTKVVNVEKDVQVEISVFVMRLREETDYDSQI